MNQFENGVLGADTGEIDFQLDEGTGLVTIVTRVPLSINKVSISLDPFTFIQLSSQITARVAARCLGALAGSRVRT